MASIMMNKPSQEMNDLRQHMANAAQQAKNGNPEYLVRSLLQQNPQLAQRYQMLMSRFPNSSPQEVLNALSKRYGINMNEFMFR